MTTDGELVAKEVRAVLAGVRAEPDPRPVYRLLGERRLLAVSRCC